MDYSSLERVGVKTRWLWVISWFVAISPLNGFYVNTLWKDILYSGFVLLITIYIFNIIATKGMWLKSKVNLLLFAIILFFSATFRGNGIVPAILIGLFLFIYILYVKRAYWWRVIITGALFMVLFLGYNVGIMKGLNVSQPPFANGVGLPLQDCCFSN